MLLKIGDLAKRTGLTIRALHHYDSIKLLTPSARSDAGYRLYNQADIARLHQILALRQFGLSLADIVSRQIATLTEQIAGATALCKRLLGLAGQLARGQEPFFQTYANLTVVKFSCRWIPASQGPVSSCICTQDQRRSLHRQ
jgi:hypothetical protein